MKTGFREHSLTALLAAALLFGALYWLGELTPLTALAGALFFAVSGVLPDIDSKTSIPRRHFRKAVLLAGVLLALAAFPFLTESFEYGALIALAIPAVVYFASELVLPGHRGFMHSHLASVGYGAVVVILLDRLAGLEWDTAFFIGLCAACGYSFHLLVDWLGDSTG